MMNREILLEKIKKARAMTPEQRAAEKAAREAEQKEKLRAFMEELKAHIAEQAATNKQNEE